jgi:hypothetical protein
MTTLAALEEAKARARATGVALAEAQNAMSRHAVISPNDPRRRTFEAAFNADQAAKTALQEAERAAAPPPPSPHDALVAAVQKRKAAEMEDREAERAERDNAAKRDEARHVVSEIESGIERRRQQAVTSGNPGEAAAAIVQERAKLGAAREYVAILDDKAGELAVRRKRASDALDMAEGRVRNKRGDYLKEAPAVFDLLRRLHENDCERAELIAACEVIESSGGFAQYWREKMPKPEPKRQLAAAWRSAIAALADDADAALPSS